MRRFALIAAAALIAACQPAANDTVEADADEQLVPVPAGTNTAIAPAPDIMPLPPEPEPKPAPTPTPTPTPTPVGDYQSDLRLTGTEPFWGVQITSGQIRLQRPDHTDITVANTGATINGEAASWNTRELKITLKPGACSDGMSDNTYPYEATVRVGGEVLRGCAARADRWPRGGG